MIVCLGAGDITTWAAGLAAGIEAAKSRLPAPAKEAQDLVLYDEEAQQVLTRAFEVAIAEGADMVDVPHLIQALGPEFSASDS